MRRTHLSYIGLCGALALTLLPQDARAQADECPLHELMPVERQLRRTSIALRGYLPTLAEYEAVEGAPAVSDALVDDYLQTDGFRLQMRRFHEQLLWPNPAGSKLTELRAYISETPFEPNNPNKAWALNYYYNKVTFRGGDHICSDKPQTDIQPGYQLGDYPLSESFTDSNGNPYEREGWVLVEPYFAPGTNIKVCAFDAQTADSWVNAAGDETCVEMGITGPRQQGCGCGPNMQRCMPFTFQPPLWRDMREQLLLTVDEHTVGGEPYSAMLTTPGEWTNGRLQFWRKHVTPQLNPRGSSFALHQPGDSPLPDNPDWNNATFQRVERSAPHSGILSLPAFTLRFQTNRSRANRTRQAFMDQFFTPPSVYDTSNCDPNADDLTKKCVCKGCHVQLEPLAAFFSPIAERGMGLLSSFDKTFEAGNDCGAKYGYNYCVQFYEEVDDPDPLVGVRLQALRYVLDHPEYDTNFNTGPKGMADMALGLIDGKPYSHFARASVKNLFAFLLKRPMDLDPLSPDNEQDLLDELATDLYANDSLAAIVKRIVTLDAFRRTP